MPARTRRWYTARAIGPATAKGTTATTTCQSEPRMVTPVTRKGNNPIPMKVNCAAAAGVSLRSMLECSKGSRPREARASGLGGTGSMTWSRSRSRRNQHRYCDAETTRNHSVWRCLAPVGRSKATNRSPATWYFQVNARGRSRQTRHSFQRSTPRLAAPFSIVTLKGAGSFPPPIATPP